MRINQFHTKPQESRRRTHVELCLFEKTLQGVVVSLGFPLHNTGSRKKDQPIYA